MANYRLAEDFSATQVEAIESGADPSQYGPRPGTQGAWVKLTRGRDRGKLAFHYLPIPRGDGVQQIDPSEALRELQGLGVSQSQGSLPGPEQVQRNSASISNPFDLLSQMQASGRLTQNQSNEWVGMLQQASDPNAELVEVPEFGILPDVWGIFQQFGITPTVSSDASFHLGDETQFSAPLYEQGIGKGDVAKLLELLKTKIKPKEIQKIEDDSTLITKIGQEFVLHPKAITSMIHLLLQIESTMPVIPDAATSPIAASATPSELLGDIVGGRIDRVQGIARNIAISEAINSAEDSTQNSDDEEYSPDNAFNQDDYRFSSRFPSRTTRITANAHLAANTGKNVVNEWNNALATVTGALSWDVLRGQRNFTAEDILRAFPRMPGVLDDGADVKAIVYTNLWLSNNLPENFKNLDLLSADPKTIYEILKSVSVPAIIKEYSDRTLNILANSPNVWKGITKSEDFKKNFDNMLIALSLKLEERVLSAKKAIEFNDLNGIQVFDENQNSRLTRVGQFVGRIRGSIVTTPTGQVVTNGQFQIGDFALNDDNNLLIFSTNARGNAEWQKITKNNLDFISQILAQLNIEGNTDSSSYIVPINSDSLSIQGEIANANYKPDYAGEYIKISSQGIPNGNLDPYITKIRILLQENPFYHFNQELFSNASPAFVRSDLYGRYGPTAISQQTVSEDISNDPFQYLNLLFNFLIKYTNGNSLEQGINLLETKNLFDNIVSINNYAKNYIQQLTLEGFHDILKSISIPKKTGDLLYKIGGEKFLSENGTDIFTKAIIYSYLSQTNSSWNLPKLSPVDLQKISTFAPVLQSFLSGERKKLTQKDVQIFKEIMDAIKLTIVSFEGLNNNDLSRPVLNTAGANVNIKFDDRFDELVNSCVFHKFLNGSLENLSKLINKGEYRGTLSTTKTEYTNIVFSDESIKILKPIIELLKTNNIQLNLGLTDRAKTQLGLVTSEAQAEKFLNGTAQNPNEFINDTQRQILINSQHFKDAMYKLILNECADKIIKDKLPNIDEAELLKIKEDIHRAIRLNEPGRISNTDLRNEIFNGTQSEFYKVILSQPMDWSYTKIFDRESKLTDADKKYFEDMFLKKLGTFLEKPVSESISYVHTFDAPGLAKRNSINCAEKITGLSLGINDDILPAFTDKKYILDIAKKVITQSSSVTNKEALDLMVAYEAAHDFFALRDLQKTTEKSVPKIDGFDIPRTTSDIYDLLMVAAENKFKISKEKNIRIIRGNDPDFPAPLRIAHPSSTLANPMGLTDSISLLGDSSLLYSPMTASFHAGVNGIGLDVPSVESGDSNQLDFWAGQLLAPQTTDASPGTQNAKAKLQTMSKEIREVAAHYGLGLDKKIVQLPSGESKTAEEIIGYFDGIKNKDIFSNEAKEQIHNASLQMQEVLDLITKAKDKYISEVIEPFVQKMRENNHHIVVAHGYDRTGGITIGKRSVQSSVADVPFFKTPWQHSDDIIHNIFWSKILNEEPSVAEKTNPNMFDAFTGTGLNFSGQNSQLNPDERSLQTFSYLGINFDNIADAFATAILLHPANNFAIPDIEKFVEHIQSSGIQLSRLISLNGSINENLLRAFFPVGNEPESWKKSWHRYAEEIGPGQTNDEYFKYQLSSALTGAYHNLGSAVLKESIQKRLEGIFRGILYAKISQNESLKNNLLQTGDQKLSGVNARILMSIRQQLKEKTAESGSRLIIIPRSSTFTATENTQQSKRAFDISWQDAYRTSGQYGNLVVSPMLPVTKTTDTGLALPSWASGDFIKNENGEVVVLPKENGLKLTSRKMNNPQVVAARGTDASDATYSAATTIDELHNQEEIHAIKLILSRNIFLGNLPSLQMNFGLSGKISNDQSALESISERLKTSFGQNKAVTLLQKVLASFRRNGFSQVAGFLPSVFISNTAESTNNNDFNDYLRILYSGRDLIANKKRVDAEYDAQRDLPQGDLGGVLTGQSARAAVLADGVIAGAIKYGIFMGAVWDQNKTIATGSFGDYDIARLQTIDKFSPYKISEQDYRKVLKRRSIPLKRVYFFPTLSPFQPSDQNFGTISFSPQLNSHLNPHLVIAGPPSNRTNKKNLLSEITDEVPVINSYQLRFGDNGEFVVNVKTGNIKSRVAFGSSRKYALQINTVFSLELFRMLQNGQLIKLTENTYAQPYRIPEVQLPQGENRRGEVIFGQKIIGGLNLGEIYDAYSSNVNRTVFSLAKNEVANYIASTIHQIVFASGNSNLIHPIIPVYGPQINPLFPIVVSNLQSLPIKILKPTQNNSNLFETKTHRSEEDLSSSSDMSVDISETSVRAGTEILLPKTVTSLLNFENKSVELSSPLYWIRLPSPFSVTRSHFVTQAAIYNTFFPFGIPDTFTSHTDTNGNFMTIEQIATELASMAQNGTWNVNAAQKLATVMRAIYPKNDWTGYYQNENNFLQNIFKTDPNNLQNDNILDSNRAAYWSSMVVPFWNKINNLHQMKQYLTGATTQMDVQQQFDPHEEFGKYFGIPTEIVRQMSTQDFVDHFEKLKQFADFYAQTSAKIQNGITASIESALQKLQAQNVLPNIQGTMALTEKSASDLLAFIANSNGDFSQIDTIGPLNIKRSLATVPPENIVFIANEILQNVGRQRLFDFGKTIKDFAKMSGRFIGTSSEWIDRLSQRSALGQILSSDPQSPIIAKVFSGLSFDTGAGIQPPTSVNAITEFQQDFWAETFLQNMARQKAPVIATFMPILSYSGINTDVEGAKIQVSAEMPAIITSKNGLVNKTAMEILSQLYVPQGTGVDFSSIRKLIQQSTQNFDDNYQQGMFGDHNNVLIINPLLMGNLDLTQGTVDLRPYLISSLFSNIAFAPSFDNSEPPDEIRSDSEKFKKILDTLQIQPENCEGTFADNLLQEFFTKPQIQSMDGKVRRAFIYSIIHAMSRYISTDFDQINISDMGLKLRDQYEQLTTTHTIRIPELIDPNNLSANPIGYVVPSAPVGISVKNANKRDAEARREELAQTPFLRQFLRAVYNTERMSSGFVPNITNASQNIQIGINDILSNQAGFSYSPLANDNEIEAALWVLNRFATSEMYRTESRSATNSNGQRINYNVIVPDSAAGPGQLFVNMGSSRSSGSRIIAAIQLFLQEISEESKFYTSSAAATTIGDKEIFARQLNRAIEKLKTDKKIPLDLTLSDEEKFKIIGKTIERSILKEATSLYDKKYIDILRSDFGPVFSDNIIQQLAGVTRQIADQIVPSKIEKLAHGHETQRARVLRQRNYAQERINELTALPSITQQQRGMIRSNEIILNKPAIDQNLLKLWADEFAKTSSGLPKESSFRFLGGSLLEKFLGSSLSHEYYKSVLENEDSHIAELGQDIIDKTPANIIVNGIGSAAGLTDIISMNSAKNTIIVSAQHFQSSPDNNPIIFYATDARSYFSPFNNIFPISFSIQGPNNIKYNFTVKTLAQFMYILDVDAAHPDGLTAIREIENIDLSKGKGSVFQKINRAIINISKKYPDCFNNSSTSVDQEFSKFVLGIRLRAEQNPRLKQILLSAYNKTQNLDVPFVADGTDLPEETYSLWMMKRTGASYDGLNILGRALQTAAQAISLSDAVNSQNKISALTHHSIEEIIAKNLDVAASRLQTASVSSGTLGNLPNRLSDPFSEGFEVAYISGRPAPALRIGNEKMHEGANIIGPRNMPLKYLEYFNLRTYLDDGSKNRSIDPEEEPVVEFWIKGTDGAIKVSTAKSEESLHIRNILHYLLLAKFLKTDFAEKQKLCSLLTIASSEGSVLLAAQRLLFAGKNEISTIIRQHFPSLDASKYENDYLNPDWENDKDLYLAYAMARIAYDKGLMTADSGFITRYFENIHNKLGNVAYWVPPDIARQNQSIITTETRRYYGVIAGNPAIIELSENPQQYTGHDAIGRILTWLIREAHAISVNRTDIDDFMANLNQNILGLCSKTLGQGMANDLAAMLNVENDLEFSGSSAENAAARDASLARIQQMSAQVRPIDPGPEETLDRDPDAWSGLADDSLARSFSTAFVINILKKSILPQKKPIVTFKISAIRKNR